MSGAVLALMLLLSAPPEPRASLVVRVEDIRASVGTVRVALFRTAAGYPDEARRARHARSVAAVAPAVEVRFDDLEPGPWAVAVLHDENGNGELDRNFLGVPREAYGASREASARLGVPLFEDAVMMLRAGLVRLRIALVHW